MADGKIHRVFKKAVQQAAASEEARRTLRYVEFLSDARTMPGERRVSARQGWAGEKSDFFNTLLASGSVPPSLDHQPGQEKRL